MFFQFRVLSNEFTHTLSNTPGYRPTLMDRDLQQPLYAANPMPISGMPMVNQMQPMGVPGGPTWPYAPQGQVQGSVRQVTPAYAQQQMMYAQQHRAKMESNQSLPA